MDAFMVGIIHLAAIRARALSGTLTRAVQDREDLLKLVDTSLTGATDVSGVTQKATTYTVTCLPDDPFGGEAWDLRVEFTGAHRFGQPKPDDEKWAVRMRSWCLSRSGTWDYEPIPSERTDEWITEHRFSGTDALQLAVRLAPTVEVNGQTPADLIAARAARSFEDLRTAPGDSDA